MCLAVSENAQAVAFGPVENKAGQPGGPGANSLVGTVLAGRYRVANVVATGANTVIMDSIDLENDGQVTVKVVRPEHAQDPEFRRKFRRLAEISNALTHPNIASVNDWGEIELRGASTVFWVVEALGGGSLRDLLDRGRLLEPGQALVVGLEACRALDAAHQKGLFHTELTPSKMVFGADRRLRVVDFGMARLLAEPAWADASAVPTHVARYASPEQALGLPIDAKTDVYALALVIIEAVTGSVPFAADSTVATLAGRVDKLLPVSADLGSLASVLERAGRPESADRFTAAEFGRALVLAAPRLAKPEPIPILSTGMFDTTAMRRPTDPTGGVERPAPVPDLAGVDESGVTAPSGVAPIPVPSIPEPDVAEPDMSEKAAPEVSEKASPEVTAPDVGEPDAAVSDVSATAAPEVTAPDVPEATGGELTVAPPTIPEPIPADDRPTERIDSIDAPTPVVAPSAGDLDDDDESDDAAGDATEIAADDDTDDDTDDDDGLRIVDSAPSDPVPSDPVTLDPIPDFDVAGVATTAIPTTPTAFDDHGGELYDDAPTRRRRGPVVLLVLLLLIGLGALGYAGSLLLRTKSFEIPALAGVPQDQALNQIAGNDWNVEILRERSDPFPDVDTVIRTVPGPGIDLDEGEPFTLVLSDGPEFRILPELNGLPFDAASAQLAGLGLTGVEAPVRQFSETVPDGSVISWQVQGDADGGMQAGSQILPGETIEMVLSQGPEPRVVPDLAGQTLESATPLLGGVQLVVAQGDDVFSDTVPVGQVVAQSPVAGESIARDATVTVQLSKGPDVVAFPDLTGLDFATAQQVLNDNALAVGSLLGTTEGTFVQASVAGADVAPGTVLPRGTAVDVIFL